MAMLSFSVLPGIYTQAGFKEDGETFVQFLLTVFAVSLTMNSVGHLLAAAAPNGQVAGILGGVIVALFNIFKYVRKPWWLDAFENIHNGWFVRW
jgi:ABC-type multidrug transport system permease subunit